MGAEASDVARYRVEAEGGTLLRPLDDVCLIYHRASGQTHLVVSPVPEILAALGPDACTAADIAARLSSAYELGDESAAIAAIAVHLEELSTLGLVRRL